MENKEEKVYHCPKCYTSLYLKNGILEPTKNSVCYCCDTFFIDTIKIYLDDEFQVEICKKCLEEGLNNIKNGKRVLKKYCNGKDGIV